MQGRFHYYEGYKMNEVTFPIRILSKLGINKLILTNAAGGVNLDFVPGDLMVIKDHINLSMNNPLIGKNLDDFGPRFPDMSETYSKRIIEILKNIYSCRGVRFVNGIYACLTGPSYETPAEIKMLRVLGADAVGMSTVPEAILAKHCGMEVCGVSCITNMAAGILDKPLSHKEVIETSNMVKDKFKLIIKDLLNEL
jgi:purine-nucleoside phosphorylase